MLRRMCRGKIHRATVTRADVNYEGSIEIDENLMQSAGILENEMVLVANLANGQRFETYVIKGARDSGVVALNGAAARLGEPGHKVIIMSVAWMEEADAGHYTAQFVEVDDKNKIKKVRARIQHV